MKCFYHNDMDGRCAGAVVAYFDSEKEEYLDQKDFYEVDYIQPIPTEKVNNGETVYFVDYSFKENTMHILKELQNKGCDIVWIDHHTSSIELEKKYIELKEIKGFRMEGISGAALTYMYFCERNFNEIPYFLQLVSDYDCWQYKFDPDTTNFKLGIDTIEHNALDKIWFKLLSNPSSAKVSEIIFKGKQIKEYIDMNNKFHREAYCYETEIEGYKCAAINRSSNSWVFGEKYNEYPLVMVWVFNGETYKYSLYSSKPDVDCSKIAAIYGGGGHRGAAGFSSKELLFKKI